MSDIAIASLSDSKKVEVEVNVEDGKAEKSKSQKILHDALLDLCKVLFSHELVEDANKVIKCFSEACLDTGCMFMSDGGELYDVKYSPFCDWRTLTPFRRYGFCKPNFNFAKEVNRAIVERKLVNISVNGQVVTPVSVTGGESNS